METSSGRPVITTVLRVRHDLSIAVDYIIMKMHPIQTATAAALL